MYRWPVTVSCPMIFAGCSNSRIDSVADVFRLFRITDGFYRPLVSLTFGLDRLAFGINPRPYGWTNVGLVLIGALLIRQLAMTLGLTRGAGTLAASLWFLNFHGINQSILWVSGRTSLLVACAGTACAIFIVQRRLLWAVVFLALACFAKEEALTLPFVLAAWLYILGQGILNQDDPASRIRTMATWLLGSAVVIASYLAIRSQTGAMTPATAPDYYQFTFEPAVVLRNALEYANRAVTTPAIAGAPRTASSLAEERSVGSHAATDRPLRRDLAGRRVWHHLVSPGAVKLVHHRSVDRCLHRSRRRTERILAVC